MRKAAFGTSFGCIAALMLAAAAWLWSVPSPGSDQKKPDDARPWAFRVPVRPPVPAVKNAAWVRNPIDAFIAARLE